MHSVQRANEFNAFDVKSIWKTYLSIELQLLKLLLMSSLQQEMS